MEPESSQKKDNKQTNDVKNPLPAHPHDNLASVKHVTAWVMILSATIFALIGVLAVWQVFGQHAHDVVWRAFVSLVIISFAALVANIGASIPKTK